MGLRDRVERFYELLPAWVRHSLTTLLSLTTLVLGACMAFVWFMGLYPALIGTMVGGYQPELAEQHPTLVRVSAWFGLVYFWGSWVFYVVGAALIPTGWVLQLGALKWPGLHWASRLASVGALACFVVPLGLLAVQWGIILWLT